MCHCLHINRAWFEKHSLASGDPPPQYIYKCIYQLIHIRPIRKISWISAHSGGPEHSQNIPNCSLCLGQHILKIQWKSVHQFPVMLLTDRPTYQQMCKHNLRRSAGAAINVKKSSYPPCRNRFCGETSFSITHWDRVTHIYVGKLIIIGSDNGLSPGRCQAIIWTNVGILLNGPLGTHFSEILIYIQTYFHWRKYVWKCRLRNVIHLLPASMW